MSLVMNGYLKDLVSGNSFPLLFLEAYTSHLASHLLLSGTYIPRKEVEVVDTIQATVIRPNQAIKLQARKECKDREGNKRVTGTPAVSLSHPVF